MSEKTKDVLKAGLNSNYPDNTTGDITPLATRTQNTDQIDSALNLAETIAQVVQGPVNFTGSLSVNGAPVVTGIITVNSEASFPTQDGTTITLEAGKVYLHTTSFSVSKRFICEEGSAVTALNQLGVIITYTGTGNMYSGVDVNFKIFEIGINAPTGTFFDFEDAAPVNSNIFWCNAVVGVTCAKFGRLDSLASLVITDTAVTTDCTDGLTIEGTSWRVWRIQNSGFITSSSSFVGIDLGTATASAVGFGPVTFVGTGGVGAVGFSGLTNSANIIAGNIARIVQTNYLGSVDPLVGLTRQDVRWEFQQNSLIPDSVNEADVYLTGGAETITTGSAGDWQEIGVPSAGGVSWASDIASRFTVGTNGVITYIGERDVCLRVSGRATVEKVGGGSNVIEVRLAKNWNGTVSDSGIEKSRAQTENIAATSVPIGALVDFTNGDNMRVIFSNMNGTSDIIANVSALEIA